MPVSIPLDRYVSKLLRRCDLSIADRTALLSLPTIQKTYPANGSIIASEVEPSFAFCVVNEGCASCFKVVEGTHRHTVAFALPGDAIDLPSLLLGHPTVHAQALVPTETTWVDCRQLLDLCRNRTAIAEAVWLDTLIDANIAREWAANLGQRRAQTRLAHLLLELHERLLTVGLAEPDGFLLRLKQQQIADALGLSLVHMNKSLGALRRAGLIDLEKGYCRLADKQTLITETGFDPRYLRIGGIRTAIWKGASSIAPELRA